MLRSVTSLLRANVSMPRLVDARYAAWYPFVIAKYSLREEMPRDLAMFSDKDLQARVRSKLLSKGFPRNLAMLFNKNTLEEMPRDLAMFSDKDLQARVYSKLLSKGIPRNLAMLFNKNILVASPRSSLCSRDFL